jgi:uncharacterized protein YdeI (BOF family)
MAPRMATGEGEGQVSATTVRMAGRMDREWRRLITMVVAVLLALGAVVAIASLQSGSDGNQITNQQQGGTRGATGPAPVSHVGGSGNLQYKVLP